MKNTWVWVVVATVVLFGGAILLSGSPDTQSNEGVEVKENIKGNPAGSVTLVEYSDFQCPACAAFHSTVKQVIELYGDDVRFEYKHFPLSNAHPHALTVAVAAEAAGQQGKFFEFHDRVFETQQDWSGLMAVNSHLVGIAEEIGLDVEQFKLQMKSSVLRDKVRAEFDEGRELGVTGTPTFFLNGKKLQSGEDYRTFDEFVTLIGDTVSPTSSSSDSAGADVNFGL